MYQQAPARQADETICFECGRVVKRDARLCPECGKRIVAEPKHVADAPGSDVTKLTAHPAVQDDVAGAGRYIINFILAGFVGLGLTFFLRRQGWLATWICVPIFVLGIVVIVASGGASP
jgi:hypothetical protein